MSGWGEVELFCGSSEDLMYAEAWVLDDSKCANYSILKTKFDEDSMTCAGVLDDSTGLGFGDSGGPLACNNKLCGVSSWDLSSWAFPEFPSVFAKVPAFNDWILENIKM